jgi:hypothetical protein
MLMTDLLNLLIQFISFHILAYGYWLVISLWSLCEDSLLFCKFGIMIMHNCLNTYLYTL